MSKIESYIPIYNRPPNKLIKYKYQEFDDGIGHTAQLKIAQFLDKNKKEKEMIAIVNWY